MMYLRNVSTLDYNSGRCNGCGRCVEVCPHGVFSLTEGRASVIERDRCMECGACARNCATGAITVDAGVGCAQALIRSMVSGGEASCGCGSSTNGGCCG